VGQKARDRERRRLIYASTRRLAQLQRIRGMGGRCKGGSWGTGLVVEGGAQPVRGIPVQRHTCALDLLISVTFLFIIGRLPSRKPQPPQHPFPYPRPCLISSPPPYPPMAATFGFISNRSGCVAISRLGVSFVHV